MVIIRDVRGAVVHLGFYRPCGAAGRRFPGLRSAKHAAACAASHLSEQIEFTGSKSPNTRDLKQAREQLMKGGCQLSIVGPRVPPLVLAAGPTSPRAQPASQRRLESCSKMSEHWLPWGTRTTLSCVRRGPSLLNEEAQSRALGWTRTGGAAWHHGRNSVAGEGAMLPGVVHLHW